MKKGKIEANTPQDIKPPNSTRVQKPHNQRKDLNPYKYTSAPQNPPKTPLKREIKPYSNAMHHKQSRQADKRRGTRHESRTSHKSRPPATQWTPPPPPQKRMKAAPRKPQTQNIFHFCPFRSPIFPRKHQAPPKNYSLSPLFALIRCPFDLVECRRSPEAEANESLFDI